MKLKQALLLVALAGFAQASQASLVNASPGGDIIAAPTSIQEGDLEHNRRIRAFDENIVTLTQNRNVNWVPGGGTGTLAAGTKLQSHLIHFDKVETDPSTQKSRTVTFTFSDAIIGIIWGDGKLSKTDPGGSWEDFGLNSVTYGGGSNRKMNAFDKNHLVVSGNQATFKFKVSGGDLFDQARVLTAVPVPTAVWLFGSGLLGLAGLRGKKPQLAS
jgi:hypothetical protein